MRCGDGCTRRLRWIVVIGAHALVVGIAVLTLTLWVPRWVTAVLALVYIAASLGASR